MKQQLLSCSCCNKRVSRLVSHHWYEPPNYYIHYKEICLDCNHILLPWLLWEEIEEMQNCLEEEWFDHILPKWDLQRYFVSIYPTGNLTEYNKKLRQEYIFPLPIPKEDRMELLPITITRKRYLEIWDDIFNAQ